MKGKSIFLIIWLMGLSSITLAQEYAIDKKAIIISGAGSLLSQGGDLYESYGVKRRITTINFSPNVNYFISKHLFIGGGIDFYQVSGNGVDPLQQRLEKVTNYFFGIGPQIGYAFGGTEAKVFPYINLGLRYYRSRKYYVSRDFIQTGTNAVFGFGLIVPVKTHFGILLEGGYHMIRVRYHSYDLGNTGNTLSIGAGIAGLLFNKDK